MHVKDINTMDDKKKFLYRRVGNPLDPTYNYQNNEHSTIDGNKPANRHKVLSRREFHPNSTVGIDGAQPKVLGIVYKHMADEKM